MAARGCGAAGSGPSGESNKCPKTFRVGTLNMGTMQGKSSEVVETVLGRGVDLCCLQETMWKKDGVKQIVGKDSRFKMFWSGNENGTGGVGILLAEEWWERVFEAVRVSDRIIFIEFPWNPEDLSKESPVAGPSKPITLEMITKAISKMASGKAAGPSGIVAEMLKPVGESGAVEVCHLIEDIISEGRIPTDWQESYIVNLYKGKGDALNRGNLNLLIK